MEQALQGYFKEKLTPGELVTLGLNEHRLLTERLRDFKAPFKSGLPSKVHKSLSSRCWKLLPISGWTS